VNDLLIVSQTDVPRLLPMRDCIEVMQETLIALAEGKTILPLRTVIPLPGQRGAFACMPAVLGAPTAMGVKVITVFPGNEGTAYDSHQGAVLLFEPEHGSLVAVLDASSITALRTAAVSAVATRALARPDSAILSLLGSGVQAVTHLEAMLAVRPIAEVRVYSRTGKHAETFAARESRRFSVPIEVVGTAEQAARGAHIICTLTSSRTPVLHGEWLAPGCHINAVGASQRTARELDAVAVQRSRLFVDRRESAVNESGDYLMALEEGLISADHIVADVGDVLLNRSVGRTSAEEITLFKSLGLAVEDVAAAEHIYRRTRDLPDSPRVHLGGRRE
jgi:ornithine cyclodeaminase/alanine dehydrogenase-like protein (mu-crystallin family)